MITEYIVLQRQEGKTADVPAVAWMEVGRVPASSASAAIRANHNGNGIHVAVPARSWHPVTITVETVKRTKLEAV